ncbi:RlpA-like double-psi beta-barrel domain-containing protein [Sorangium sp. So ce590]|uniref:RlpA-like double-psi beta-barrel domain-containing protein n=1 Tax=Sorangium sp. So ce590 TaxID=3133317 RepID=UPI003F5EB67F
MSSGLVIVRAMRPCAAAILVAMTTGCGDSTDKSEAEAALGEAGEALHLSGFVSFHQEYNNPGIGAHVACAPDAFSVPDWNTRFEPSKFGFMVSALQSTHFDRLGKHSACAMCARVTSKRSGRSVTVRIIDRSTDTFNDGGKRFLDLSAAAFGKIGNTDEGVLPADITFVDCPAGLLAGG